MSSVSQSTVNILRVSTTDLHMDFICFYEIDEVFNDTSWAEMFHDTTWAELFDNSTRAKVGQHFLGRGLQLEFSWQRQGRRRSRLRGRQCVLNATALRPCYQVHPGDGGIIRTIRRQRASWIEASSGSPCYRANPIQRNTANYK